MARQQRRVDVERVVARQVEHGTGNEATVVGEHDEIGPDVAQLRLHGIIAQRARGKDGQAALGRQLGHGRGREPALAAGRPGRDGDHRHDVDEAAPEQVRERRQRDGAAAEEERRGRGRGVAQPRAGISSPVRSASSSSRLTGMRSSKDSR